MSDFVDRLARALAATKGYTPAVHAEVYGDIIPDYLDAPHEWYMSPRELAEEIVASLDVTPEVSHGESTIAP